MSDNEQDGPAAGIAVVGMAGRFPGAAGVERFWQNLTAGIESVTFFGREELAAAGVAPALLDHPAYVPARAALDGADLFDAGLFGYSPREAEVMDPQHRQLLECAWEALEHAGYDPRRYDGLIGVYVGSGPSSYLLFNLATNREVLDTVGQFQTHLGNGSDFLATRLSYKLGLRGPSLTLQCACSTSLVAVHLAAQSLLNGECDLALAGGVRVLMPRPAGYLYQPDGILSPDGHCRPFDAASQGAVDGEGAGMVVLKRLADALADGDRVHAVILGTAMNNDGALRVGYTAPGVEGQAAVVAMAQAVAGVHPETIGFVEGHGTGTPLGDPVEVTALRQVFEASTARKGFCALGSVKSNVGHLDTAAGVTSLIKAVLAVEHGLIPPTAHFTAPNPRLGLPESPFFVNAAPLPWPSGPEPRRAGVSSFGMGGTNCHVVLEEPPPMALIPPGDPSAPWQLLVLSAASAPALEAATDRLAGHLARNPGLDLGDVAFTLQVGRQELAHRRMLVCRSLADAREALAARDPRRVLSAVVDEGRSGEAVVPAGQDPESLETLGRLWLAGAEVDWQALRAGERRLRVPLPAYPFEHQRYWIAPQAEERPRAQAPSALERPAAEEAAQPPSRRPRPAIGTPYEPPRDEMERRLAGLFEDLLGIAPVGAEDNFFELGGHSLLGLQLLSRVKSETGVEVRLEWLFKASTVAELAEMVAILREEELEGAAGPTETAETAETAGTVDTAAPLPPVAPDLIPRVPRGRDLPLSFAQERLWFLDRLDPGTTTFNLNESVLLTGALDLPALARTLAEVVRRHESLRTAFVDVQGRPAQRILPALRVPLPLVDLSALPAERREDEAVRLATAAGERPFDLARPPLLLAELYRIAPDRHALALVYHHIVGDGWSSVVLLQELAAIYRSFVAGEPSPLPEPPIQYADFASWQRSRLGEQELARQLAGWRERLAPPLPVLDLPTDRPRPAVQTFRGKNEVLALPPALAQALRGMAAAQGATPFMVLLSGFALLLCRWSGQEEVIVGTPMAGRDRRELERLIGIFLNMLPLRIGLAGEPSFRALLGRVRETAVAAYAGQDVPVERLIEEVRPGRNLARAPLFQVLFNLQSFPGRSFEVPGLAIAALPLREVPARFDLTVYGEEIASGELLLDLVYNADLFDRATVVGLLAQLRQLLERAAAMPDFPVSRLSLLTPEAAAVLPDPRVPLAAGGWTGAVHERFAERARRAPERLAVADPAGTWTYGELAERAGRLAGRLWAAGIGRGDLVAIHAHRSAPLVQALLGVLQAGAAFLVLDPAHPAARLRSALRQARPRAWVGIAAAGPLPDELAEALAGLPWIVLDASGGTGGEPGTLPAPAPAGPGDLAYLAFTSGSTGEPKGILGTHGPLVHFCAWQAETFGLGPDDRFSLLSGLAHDPLLRDVFTPLTLGAAVCVPQPDDLGSPPRLGAWMAASRVTVCHLTPAFGQILTDGATPLPALRRAFFGGDALTELDVARLRALAPAAACVNFYGTTETPQGIAWHDASGAGAWPARRVPVGRGIDGVQLLVLDAAGGLAAPGELGEVCVRTPHLALGYLGDERLTAERYVANPFAEGADRADRVYRTGDLGRYRADGAVDLAGRRDGQVQVRGFRVEPAEVEAALALLPPVREAAVLLRDGRLTAWLAAAPGPWPAAAEVREHLRRLLPEPMVPEAFVWLDRLPLTPNGKLDRRALPEPAREEPREGGGFEAPATPLEEGVAAIWRDLLALEEVGRHDNFFELGGHSLLATRMVAALRERFGVDLPLRTLFARPTVAEVARAVAASRQERTAAAAAAVRGRTGLPLSFAQERLWFLDQLAPGNPAYNIPLTVRLAGRLDAARLGRCLGALVVRHETLRTTFRAEGGRPLQDVAPPSRFTLPVVDLSALPARLGEPAAEQLAAAEWRHPFDLARGPLMRALLLRLDRAASDHLVVFNLHHVISDGWSMGVLVRELVTLYGAGGDLAALPPLPLQYADFARWQREWLAGEVLEEQLGYWRRRLDGAPALLELPADRPRPAVASLRGGWRLEVLPPALAARLHALGREAGTTLFMTLLAAFQALLCRVAGVRDVVVGSPIANRTRASTEGLIGFFVNTLALRCDLRELPPEPTFADLLAHTRETAVEAYAHQDLPFDKLVEELQPERHLSHAPLFQAGFVLQNAPLGPQRLAGLTITPVRSAVEMAKFDLGVTAFEDESGIALGLGYSADLFDATRMARMLGHYASLLAAAADDRGLRLAELPLLSPAERQQLLVEWRESPAPYARDHGPALLHELVRRQAWRLPDAVALVMGDDHLSRWELDRRARRIAGRLRELGVGPESLVGVCLERSPAMVAALLGILKAGGAYLPLDPSFPAERLAFMLADAGVEVVLTEEKLAAAVPETGARKLLVTEALAAESGEDALVLPKNPAYVIYTSGSTGQPKGVVISHAAVCERLWFSRTVEFEPGDCLLHNATISFDAAVAQIFIPLLAGGRIVLARQGGQQDPPYLLALIREQRVTQTSGAVALLNAFLKEEALAGCDSLKTVLTGAEAVPPDLPARFHAVQRARLWNRYGPTESTISVTEWLCERSWSGSLLPIGRPIGGAEVALLDPGLEPVPAGVPGELCIGGPTLARGYLGRPDLTAERFIPDPSARRPGRRLYRTGDLARFRADGALEFLGRVDQQVKVRGFRVELGEIETALAQHPGVGEAAVVARDEPDGGKRLVAYVVPKPGSEGLGPSLRARLKERLPDYMVPAAIVELAELPLAPTGKVDRQALALRPPAALELASRESEPPRNPVEEVVAGLWADLLRRERVGRDESFFELGGHSLLAAQVVSRVREAFGVEVALRKLFESPTVADLAAEVEAALAAGEAGAPQAPPIRPVPREGDLPLSFAQERLWFLDRLQPGSAAYNMPAALRLRGSLDAGALAAAFGEVRRRHEALRTTFADRRGGPVQVVHPPEPVPLPVIDLASLPGPERQAEAERQMTAEATRPFDLARGPLLRTLLVRLAPADHLALVTLHHIAGDGWSIGILVGEVAALYGRAVLGLASPLPELPVQYADFAAWQRQWLAGEALESQLAYWRQRLAGAPLALDLPADRPRPPVLSQRGGILASALAPDAARGVRDLARRAQATPYMVLLAAFEALAGRSTGQDTFLLGSTIANRTRRELEGLIGFFVNTLVLRADPGDAPSFRALLGQARETALGAYAHQDLPFEKLVEELRLPRDLSRSPLVQVIFQMNNAPASELRLPGLEITPLEQSGQSAKLDLVVNLAETAGGLRAAWRYSADLFDAATIERLAGQMETLLTAALADPDRPLAELPLLTEAESRQLREWAGEGRSWPVRVCLHDRFAARAAERPDAVAVVCGEEHLSYGALAGRAERLARHLAALGVRPGDRLGLFLERSPRLAEGVLGALATGAAYVPLDPAYPADRVSYMLADAGISFLLTERALLSALPEGFRAVLIDAGLPAAETHLPGSLPPESPAYVIYTSGSTGRPKGVTVTHASALRLFDATGAWYGFGPDDVWTLFHSIAFDFSVWELWGALLHGGRLVVVPYRVSRSPESFLGLLVDESVTVLNQTPSAFRQLIWAEGRCSCSLPLEWVIFGGEALDLPGLAPWFARHGDRRPRLVNMYGITETTVHVTYRPLGAADLALGSVVGRPIPDLAVHLVDRSCQPVPVGVAGEMLVGGAGLAHGYLGRPDLTAEKFVPDPFSTEPGARLYRSGDLARRRPDGELEYLGRVDHQVKVRGYRIELGEIEAALSQHPGVREVAVLAREDRLVAYVAAGEEVTLAELRALASRTLPDYMLPAGLVTLPSLPLTAHGKVDRRALLALPVDGPRAGRAQEPPRTELERYLAGLYAESLEVEVGLDDDFFELGGNSIRGAVLVNRLQEELGEVVHVVTLFDAPTVRQLAAHLAADHRRAVLRRFGAGSLGEGAGEEATLRPVDEERLRLFRTLVRPLVPRPAPARKNPPAVFVLAPPRSGTTLLRVMLGGHPALFAPPELELLGFDSMAGRRAAFSGRDSFWLEGLLRAVMEVKGCGPDEARGLVAAWEERDLPTGEVYGLLQRWLDGRVLVDKTPSYALDPLVLARAEEAFDGALYVHLLRHPCGMIGSFEEARLDQIFFRAAHPFGRRELAELIWLASHENILSFLATVPPERQHRVAFEELVRAPEATLSRLCAFLGLPYEPAMARPYEAGKSRMTDGLHAESRMLGDVKFHQHAGVEAGAAERWRESYTEEDLGEPARRLAGALGYALDATASWSRIEPGTWAPGEPVPLSFAQERLWFLDQLERGSPAYNIPLAVRLVGALDRRALANALEGVVRRHAALRTTFVALSGTPAQVVAPLVEAPLPLVDLAGLPEPVRAAEARRLALEEARRPFDLARGPLLRTALLRLGPAEHAAVLTMHHIVSDGWSMGVLLRELTTLYGAFSRGLPSPLPELPVQYPDYAAWQRQRLTGEALAAEIGFWREALAGVPALELPTDRPRPAVQSFRGAGCPFALPAATAASALRLGAARGATPFMTLLAAFAALLHRTSGQDDFALGTPVAGRNRAELEGLIGFFVNTLAIRADLAGGPGLGDLLERVRRRTLAAFAHQEVPFEKVVQELQPQRDPSRPPLFQAMFTVQTTASASPRAVDLPGLRVEPMPASTGTAKVDLILALAESGGGLAGLLEYNRDLFERTTAERLLAHFATLLDGAAADPGRPLADLPLLAAAERHQLLAEWNDTDAAYPRGATIHELFAELAARAPEAPALLFGLRRLSYGELERQSAELARRLFALGVRRGDRVGLCLDRSPEMVVATLATLRAGAAYVPLSPADPPERLGLMAADSGIALLLTRSDLAAPLAGLAPRTILLDEPAGPAPGGLGRLTDPGTGPEDCAYVLYTSGSTGLPKGVMVPHRAVVRLVRGSDYLQLGPEDRVGFAANVSFDAATFEIWGPLLNGGALVGIAREAALAPRELAATIREQGLTVLFLTTALFQQVAAEEPGAFAPLACLLFGGEAVDPRRVRQVLESGPPARLLHLYGPTEGTTFTTWHRVEAVPAGAPTVPIGRAVANTRVQVLDRQFQPVPLGMPGELHAGGDGLAQGYLGRPELTAERFVPDPLAAEPGARLYRTGDLVRWVPGGALEFLGRADDQVKVRGFRIEPGEIEAALLALPGVRACSVRALPDPAGSLRLVAYWVPDPEGGAETPAGNDLRAALRERLPAHMVPALLVPLPALPLTANGKVDRAALPVPQRWEEGLEIGATAPRTAVEEVLAGYWCEALGLERVGVEDDFFSLGGHSLLATQVVSRAAATFRVEIPLRRLFEEPTVAGLAAAVVAAEARPGQSEKIARALLRVKGGSGESERPVLAASGRISPGGEGA